MNTETNTKNYNFTDEIFKEVRSESSELNEDKQKFEKLPDGIYNGTVYIETNNVTSENSPNRGKQKYEIRLTVSEGDHKSKMAYYHRVRFPSYLENEKPSDNAPAVEVTEWRDKVKNYYRQTDKLLKICGVDVSDIDPKAFTIRIGENNRRRSTVNFTVKDGNLYLNNLVESHVEDEEGSLPYGETTLPDGNDLPIN